MKENEIGRWDPIVRFWLCGENERLKVILRQRRRLNWANRNGCLWTGNTTGADIVFVNRKKSCVKQKKKKKAST